MATIRKVEQFPLGDRSQGRRDRFIAFARARAERTREQFKAMVAAPAQVAPIAFTSVRYKRR